MATDFPTSPTNGQLFTSSNGNVYYWDSSKTAWRARPQSLAPATVGEVPPSNPISGSLWYNSADGNLYVYYSDSNSSQWVQIRTDMSFTSTIGPAVDSLKLRSPNYIINGAFDIWQRGTSFTSGIGYTADRWTNTTAPSATITRTAVAHAGVVPEHIQYQVDISGGSVSTAGYSYYEQPIEDVRTLAGQTATLSFYAKGSVAGTIGTTFIQNFGTGGSASLFTLGANFNITTTWQRYSVTVSIPSVSGKTIGANSYLDFRFVRGLGTNYAPTTFGIPALVDYTGTLSVTGVQLEAGAQATTFRRNSPSIQGELAACQRYYETGDFNLVWAAYTANAYSRVVVPFKSTKRDGASTVTLTVDYLSNSNTPTLWGATPYGFSVQAASTAAFIAAEARGTWTASREL